MESVEYKQMKNQKGIRMENWNWQTRERVERENNALNQRKYPEKVQNFLSGQDAGDSAVDSVLEQVLTEMDNDLYDEKDQGTRVRFNMNSAKTQDTDSKLLSMSD